MARYRTKAVELRVGRRGRGVGARRPGPLPLQALLPRLRPRHGHADVVRRRDDRPRLHLRRLRLRGRHQPDHRTRASWSGRSTGRCAGPSSSVDFEPAGDGPRHAPARRSPSGKELVETDLGGAAAGVLRLLVRRHRRHAEDVVVRRVACPPPSRRAADPRGADPALALRAPAAASRRSTSTSGAEVVRLYDEWDALGRKAADPERRDAPVLAYERASARRGGTAADARRSSCRSGCCPRSPT